ncbi:MAG: DUF4097 family beta strand repeat-containing protein [Acidobacteriota bacterium]
MHRRPTATRSTRRLSVLALGLAAGGLFIFALPAAADCDQRAEREARIALDGARSIEILARAGDLSVRPGDGDAVEATGTACASKASTLQGIQLTATRRGDAVRVEVEIPETRGWRDHASLDLVVDVPPDVPVAITDSSGDIELRGITVASIEDSSGDIEGRDLLGDFRVADSSGDVELYALDGSVELTDSSGDLEIEGARGSVVVHADSSGDIEIEDVLGSVTVHADSSGDIDVARVVGDFVVERDGSGSISHREVGGRIDIPTD